MSGDKTQNNIQSEHNKIVIEKPSQSEKRDEIDIDKESTTEQFAEFLSQQEVLIEKFDKLIEKIDKGKKKDFWDALSSLSGLFTLLSSIVIAWLGVQFTDAYKKQEVRIAEAQTIEKFLSHLTNGNENSSRGALLAVYALQNNDLAARLASSYISNGSIDVCEAILKDAKGESESRLRDALIEAYVKRADDNYIDNSVSNEKLISDYNKALEFRPDEYISQKWGDWYLAGIYTARANCYRDQKNYDKANPDYEKALIIKPNNGFTYISMAVMYRNRNDFNTAISYHNKSIENSPTDGSTFTNRGETYEKMGEIDKAIFDFNEGIKTDPYYDWVYLRRALFYQRKKENDKAAQDFKEVIAITKNEITRFQAKQELRRVSPKYVQNEEKSGEQPDNEKQGSKNHN